jgi:hypothetical protein
MGLNESGSNGEKLMNKKRYLVIVGIVTIAVLLLATSCMGNRVPTITSLEAEAPGWTAPLGSLQVTCNASDRDGDVLSYNWSANGGNISGTGPEVIWTAPGEVGMYDITVVVADNKSASATKSIGLIASNGTPPVIEDLIVTAEHKYLKEITTGYKVAKTYNYSIGCNASGNGTLSYNWTCTGGNVSGEGSVINWTAPNAEVNITVTVKVFDGTGNWVRKSVVLEVVRCTPCEFE